MKFIDKFTVVAMIGVSAYIGYYYKSPKIGWSVLAGMGILFGWFKLREWYAKWKKEPRYKRVPIPDDVKREVWRRQSYSCATCPENRIGAIEFHHKVPSSKGGSSTDTNNIVGLCAVCHGMKSRFDQRTGAYQ